MRFALFFVVIAFLTLSCASPARPVEQNSAGQGAAAPGEKPQTADKQQPPADGSKSKWTQGGEPVDTTQFDKEIAAAEKELALKSTDEKAKKTLAEAYYKRAVALTDKRQYASALGDYRRTVKYDPTNADAKGWIDKITMIYDSLNKASPKEGEEPPPLPFNKG